MISDLFESTTQQFLLTYVNKIGCELQTLLNQPYFQTLNKAGIHVMEVANDFLLDLKLVP